MNVEDRLRAATEAVTEAMRPVRPLDLRPRQAEDPAPARPRRIRWSAWPVWLAPVAAAAVVFVLAASLAVLHQVRPAPAGSSSASGAPAMPAQVPRYFAAIVRQPAKVPKDWYLTVGDDRTGRTLATFAPPKGQLFQQVVAGADDRTFVLTSEIASKSFVTRLWYLVRITPGASRPVTMTKLPLKFSGRSFPDVGPVLEGLALSPNGRELAVMSAWQIGATMNIYSVATGAVLRTWSTGSNQVAEAYFGSSLTWLADGHRLAFLAGPVDGGTVVRTLDTKQPGTHMIRDSKVLLRLPDRCARVLVAPAGGTVICALPPLPLCGPGCVDIPRPPAWQRHCGIAYVYVFSVATGKQVAAIKPPPACQFSYASLLWADASGSTFVFRSVIKPHGSGNKSDKLVVSANGRLTSFPSPFRGSPAVDGSAVASVVVAYGVAL